MRNLTRRSLLRSSIGVAAAGTLIRPFIANAAAATATVWYPQGFVPEEDDAIKKIVAEYEKASGNTIDLSIMPFAPQRQKIVSAVTSGAVPDLFPSNPDEIVALYAWDDKLVTSATSLRRKGKSTPKPHCSTPIATTASKRGAAITACLV